jgi:hypothetical protein
MPPVPIAIAKIGKNLVFGSGSFYVYLIMAFSVIPVLFFPVNTLHRTSIHRFFDAVFGPTFGQNDLCFLLCFIKSKHFRTEFHTTFTANAFIGIDYNSFSHRTRSFLHILYLYIGLADIPPNLSAIIE